MKKTYLAVLFLTAQAYAGLISHTDYTAGNVITAAGQNTNENAIVDEINGNLDAANIEDLSITASEIANNTITAGKIDTTNFAVTLPTATIQNFTSTSAVLGVVVASSVTVSSMTVSTMTVSSMSVSYFNPPVYSSMTIQIVHSRISGSSSTVATSFIPTTLTATITPRFATSRIKITASGAIYTDSVLRMCIVTFLTGSGYPYTDLSANSAGYGHVGQSGATHVLVTPFAATDIHSPATASAITYTVGIRTSNSGASCALNPNTGTAVLILEELR